MSESKIEWTDRSDWNPIRGCTRVSPGCGGPGDHGGCYAESLAARFSKPGMWGHGFAEMRDGKPRWTGKVELQDDRLTLPLKWRKPALIFVNSTSDLFHEVLQDYEIAQVFGVMTCATQHTYQVLTKRPHRMAELLSSASFWEEVNCFSEENAFDHSDTFNRRTDDYRATSDDHDPQNPPSNIWLGVSCERQQEADERIPLLLQTPAAVRFISAEPLLGAIQLDNIEAEPGHFINALTCDDNPEDCSDEPYGTRVLDWVIVGGESGSNARPMHPDWARSLRDQCQAAGIPIFFKQRGEYTWVDGSDYDDDRIPELPTNWRERTDDKFICMRADGSRADGYGGDSAEFFYRVGKKAAGRLLDGREHNDFPSPQGQRDSTDDDAQSGREGFVQS